MSILPLVGSHSILKPAPLWVPEKVKYLFGIIYIDIDHMSILSFYQWVGSSNMAGDDYVEQAWCSVGHLDGLARIGLDEWFLLDGSNWMISATDRPTLNSWLSIKFPSERSIIIIIYYYLLLLFIIIIIINWYATKALYAPH